MSILRQLSSQRNDRTEFSNRRVVVQCLEAPDLLDEIAAGLQSGNAALMGDCAEVMTQVAKQHPEWITPFANILVPLLAHKTARVRWEAMHALALTAGLVPDVIAPVLPTLEDLMQNDPSVIVRDYAVDTVGNYAATGPLAAEAAYPLLVEALSIWKGKHVGHALDGLANVARSFPGLQDELQAIADDFAQNERAVIRKSAKKLQKAVKFHAD
ncbi:MAG TPA: hypothetical protein PKG95_02530 [Anaerolineaceae bacterium]|nr:hypothetical protein [Anaerolineaceae bacterium]